MIIHRMKLRNFRGVDDREVAFEPRGVTILEGPNEVGKSSHIDALNLLLDFKAWSKHRDVRSVKPVHRDEGPEAEIEAEAGSYRFRYKKRWMKSPVTELEILQPKHENVTGDEAHDRVQAILAETTDLGLWRALRIMQGNSTEAVALGDSRALSKALDLSAGSTPIGEQETALYQKVVVEYDRYWTTTGREGKDLKDAETEAERLADEFQKATDVLRSIENNVERLEDLRIELANTKAQQRDLEASVETAGRSWEEAKGAAKEKAQASTALDLAKERRDNAVRAKKRLDDLESKVREATDALKEQRENALAGPDLDRARALLETRKREWEVARRVRQGAESVERLRLDDADHRHYALDLVQLRERKQAIDAARADTADVRRLLATSKATDETLDDLREYLTQVRAAEARLDAAAAHLSVERLAPGVIAVNGAPMDDHESELERRVESKTVVDIGDTARIVISPGSDIQELRTELSKHREKVDQILNTVGAADLAEAVEANRKLKNAAQKMSDVADIEKDKLRDLTYESLAERIEELTARTEEYAKRRNSDLAMPADFDEARVLLEAAKAEAGEARKNEQAAEQLKDEAQENREGLEKARSKFRVKMEVLEAQAESAQKDLEEAKPDLEETVGQLDDFEDEFREKEEAWRVAEEVIRRLDPETAKTKLDNAKQVLQAHSDRVGQLDRDIAEVHGRIKEHEEAGLFEKSQNLGTALEAARRHANSIRRRAEAARIVFEVFSEERDRARQSYVRPLQDAIERLGRILHGESFNVQVGEDLSVTHRTLDNRTLEFDQLSAGAKEQLGILIRSACALLVAKDSGIPLILDDTLGNTDRHRLEAMGAVLNRVGQDAQVIILTCVPDRFRHVGGAKVVRLEPGVAN